MKTLIVAINSKYIHSSLAPWYLKAGCTDNSGEIIVAEHTINDSLDSILGKLYSAKPDIIAFSCYIWNIGYVMKLSVELKKILPGVTIILGGPEVSFDGEALMRKAGFIDYIISGEGEISFSRLLDNIVDGSHDFGSIDGLTFRSDNKIISNSINTVIQDLDMLPSPYTAEMLSSIGNRIAYYESSRGCPFSCSYCLSSISRGVRYFSMQRVENDIDKLVSSGVKQVKFVDRTFNCSKKRAVQIMKLLIDKYGGNFDANPVNFHFEVAADLFDDEMFDILSKAPAGLIQFEIGVQTTNEETLSLIDRKTSTETVFRNTKRLKSIGRANLHLDLIAGLPKEDYNSFKKSFNDVYKLGPQQLQLGFLKMLKGARIREEAEKYGYRFREYPPYEVLENDFISFGELTELKGIEELVDRYYNSGRFIRTLDYITAVIYSSPFEFYLKLLEFYKSKEALDKGISSRAAYDFLYSFIKDSSQDAMRVSLLNELLKYDFLSSDNTNNLPSCINRDIEPGFRERCFEFLREEDNIRMVLPHFTGLPVKQIIKNVHFESFEFNIIENNANYIFRKGKIVVLFDYTIRDRVTGLYKSNIVKI